ncbi:MAG TPA: SPFH domain-containing protein, partial [Thermomicrobiales bacterium]|nr:SPFH domain-containing protein [Thermomicrobiales bacterium]
LFLIQVVGTRSTYVTSDIEDYLRSIIINEFNDMLGETLTSLLDVQGMSLDLAIAAQHALSDDFERLGLELRSFQISAITPPDEVQERIDQRSSMGILGDMRTYTQFQTAEAIGNMGEGGEGGGGGTLTEGAGLGAGLGVGMAMGEALRDAMRPDPNQNQQGQQAQPAPAAASGTRFCPNCGQAVAPGAKFCQACGHNLLTTGACPKCQTVNAPGSKFCQNCGTQLT